MRGKRSAVQFEEPGDEATPDEDCKLEVDGEAHSPEEAGHVERERSQKS